MVILHVFLALIGLFGAVADLACREICDFQKNGIEYVWEEKPNYSSSKKVFLKAFSNCYEKIPLSTLKKLSREEMATWLEEIFEETYTHHTRSKDNLWLSAKVHSETVGFLVVDISKYPEGIYLAQLAVDPLYQRQHIASSMVRAVLHQFPECRRFYVITRDANEEAKQFYTFLGFTLTETMHEGYSKELYIGFEYSNNE